jgi:hypothetical protein
MINNQKINIKKTTMNNFLLIKNCVEKHNQIIKKEILRLKNRKIELIKNEYIYKIIFTDIIRDLK